MAAFILSTRPRLTSPSHRAKPSFLRGLRRVVDCRLRSPAARHPVRFSSSSQGTGGEGPSSKFLGLLWSSTDPATPVFRAPADFAIPPVLQGFPTIFRDPAHFLSFRVSPRFCCGAHFRRGLAVSQGLAVLQGLAVSRGLAFTRGLSIIQGLSFAPPPGSVRHPKYVCRPTSVCPSPDSKVCLSPDPKVCLSPDLGLSVTRPQGLSVARPRSVRHPTSCLDGFAHDPSQSPSSEHGPGRPSGRSRPPSF